MPSRPLLSLLVALAALAAAVGARAQSERYELDSLDRWKKVAEANPGSEEAQLLAARRALIEGEPQRANKLATAFLDKYPLSKYRADALLVRGDALRGNDEYEALFDYEEICRRYPGTTVFIPALEREYEIAVEYTKGLRRRFWGTFRLVDARPDGEELLIRVQERLPGSELGEKACIALADYYFNRQEMMMASEAYRIYTENYPRGQNISKARLRLIFSYLAGFKGPEYDASGLLEARAKLRTLQAVQPALAQQVGAEGMLVRIEESEAAKFLSTAAWYIEVNDPISAELCIRRLVQRHPRSVAAIEALRIVPKILPSLPKSVLDSAPDYRKLRKDVLGVDWETMPAAAPDAPAQSGDVKP